MRPDITISEARRILSDIYVAREKAVRAAGQKAIDDKELQAIQLACDALYQIGVIAGVPTL